MSRTEVTDAQITAAQGGDSDAMWEIVQALDPMMKSIIRSAVPRATADDADDLLQEARAVLIQHVRDYSSEASSGALTSYVYRAARRAVQETHISMTSALTVDPDAVLHVRRALWEADGDMEKAFRILSDDVANPRKRMSRERFMAVVDALAASDSLDAPASGEDGDGASLTLADVIADPSSQVTDPVERRDLARWLMTQIPQRQSLALRAFYGVTMSRTPDADICADLEVNAVALRRLRSRGVVSARTVATAHGLAA